MDRTLAWCKEAGFDAWEGALPGSDGDWAALRAALAGSGMGMPSAYAGPRLHGDGGRAAIEELVGRCARAAPLGLRTLVLNPEPVDWGTQQEKTDSELVRQREALEEIETRLRAQNQGLAYHVHGAEMRSNGRELAAMCEGTPFGICLEMEWMIRGGWTQAQALAFAKEHAHRLSVAHFRQQGAGRFQLELGPGDIDYQAVWEVLEKASFQGPLVWEGYQETVLDETTMRSSAKRSAAYLRGLGGKPHA